MYGAENANFTIHYPLSGATISLALFRFVSYSINPCMIHKKLSSLILFSLFSYLSFAQAPKYSNEFLSIGVGGRPMGMSGSVVGSVNDATAAVWNPAGLTQIKGNVQVAVMHAEL